ncbi:MAG: ABC transporter ATP-binding protein [Planctomycetota bacterium]
MPDHPETLLEVADLRTEFAADSGTVTAVDGVSLTVPRGQTVALLGESGCGKSVTALSLMRLIPSPPGRLRTGRVVLYPESGGAGVDLLALSEKQMRSIRGRRLAMVFQEPMTSLNPVFTVGAQIVEAIELHQHLRGRAAWKLAQDMLERVGIPDPPGCVREYPHQLSGGMQQRVMIAMALACRPLLLIADEPTTALDVTTQAQILDLLRTLQADTGMSLLIISHDLGVVAQIANWVYVMYAGKIVEYGPIQAIFERPAHPYTQALFRCTPRIERTIERLQVIPGSVPDPADYPSGCRFHPRCALTERLARETGRPTATVHRGEEPLTVVASCRDGHDHDGQGPPLRQVDPGHFAACREL